MLITVDLDKDFIKVKRITKTSMLTLQSIGVDTPKLGTPQTNSFITDRYAALSQQVFNITKAKIKPVAHPHGIADDA
jgi:hypothetical protein